MMDAVVSGGMWWVEAEVGRKMEVHLNTPCFTFDGCFKVLAHPVIIVK